MQVFGWLTGSNLVVVPHKNMWIVIILRKVLCGDDHNQVTKRQNTHSATECHGVKNGNGVVGSQIDSMSPERPESYG